MHAKQILDKEIYPQALTHKTNGQPLCFFVESDKSPQTEPQFIAHGLNSLMSVDIKGLQFILASPNDLGHVSTLGVTFNDSNLDTRIEPFHQLNTKVSYFLGNEPGNWRTNIAAWGGIRYVDLYPGVDLELTGADGELQMQAIVKSDENIRNIAMEVEGANSISIDGNHLRLGTDWGGFLLPLISLKGEEISASMKPSIKGRVVHNPFEYPSANLLPLSNPDNTEALIFSTFIGGSSEDGVFNFVVANDGSIYISGGSTSGNFPTTPGALKEIIQSVDGVVVKLNSDGSAIEYATFIGGSRGDQTYGIGIDEYGSAYVVGETYSSDFPVTSGSYDTSFDGINNDSFSVKLTPDGTGLVYSTFLSGEGGGVAIELLLDDQRNAYITGYTYSDGFATTLGAFDETFNGSSTDTFLLKLNNTGSNVFFATLIGGSGNDQGGRGLSVDQAGNIYITGMTNSPNFPTTPGSLGPILNGGYDGYIAKFDSDASDLIYSAYLGTGAEDRADDVVVDEQGNAYVVGFAGAGFPTTPGSYNPGFNGGSRDAFVAKVNQSGSGFVYASYLGGSSNEHGQAVAIDSGGRAFITGRTGSSDFPVTVDAFDVTYNGGTYDAFITIMDSSGAAIDYSSFFGGIGSDDFGMDLYLNDQDYIYLTGRASSNDFPVTDGAYDTSYNGNTDIFVSKICAVGFPVIDASGPYYVEEGGVVLVTASSEIIPPEKLSFIWDLDNDAVYETPGRSVPFSAAYHDGPTVQEISVKASNSCSLESTDSSIVNIANAPPIIAYITAPLDPILLETQFEVFAQFTDMGIDDTHTAIWAWGDDNTSAGIVDETNGSGSVTGGYAYTDPGVYTITITVTDDDEGVGTSEYHYVVVYDPSGGFVTGGGWINSPDGAYAPDPMLSGKATFGFVSKYKKGADTPTGQTQFQFKVADLNFHSETYQWLVVAGARAQYKGTGSINGVDGYGFMLTAIDGAINGGGGVDKFRIKIWDSTTVEVVYDNKMGEPDDSADTIELGGGSIVIHKPK